MSLPEFITILRTAIDLIKLLTDKEKRKQFKKANKAIKPFIFNHSHPKVFENIQQTAVNVREQVFVFKSSRK